MTALPRRLPAIGMLLLLAAIPLTPQGTTPGETPGVAKGSMMLTIFLRHDESKTLDEINAHLKQTGFDKKFPPAGTEVVSWYVMMGIGQVVTLRFPAERHGAWGGAYHTEFYPTYDYKSVWEAQRKAPQ